MPTLIKTSLVAFVVALAFSFTAPGTFMALIFSAPFMVGGLDGLQLFWVIALFAGMPFFGYLLAFLLPGEEGRGKAFLAITGYWIGLISASLVATHFFLDL